MSRFLALLACGVLSTALPAATSARGGDGASSYELVATFGKREAASAWEAIRRIETQRLASIDPALVERLLSNPETYRYQAISREPRLEDGEYAGHWRFFGEDGDRRPYAAWRRLPAGNDALPRIELYCSGRACGELRDQLGAMHAPRRGMPTQLEAWKAAAAAEACEPGPISTPAPRYPPKLLREAVAGSVELVVLVNRCGQVRRAWVGASSGYAGLDAAAVSAAMAWRIAPPPDGQGSGVSRTRVSFGY
jgi:TonB family protein